VLYETDFWWKATHCRDVADLSWRSAARLGPGSAGGFVLRPLVAARPTPPRGGGDVVISRLLGYTPTVYEMMSVYEYDDSQ